MNRDTLGRLQALRAQKTPVVLATNLSTGEQVLIQPSDEDGLFTEHVRDILRADKARVEAIEESEWFLNPYNPPLRLFVVGAVHIAQPLVQMATLCGYHVLVVDPREAFGSDVRFPGLEISHEWPDEALRKQALDARSAVVTLSHDPKIDDPALEAALSSDCFYIGSLGSKKTHAARLERLRRAGFSEEDFERIHGPVGLAIGAKSPAEIAASIMADLIKTLRERSEA